MKTDAEKEVALATRYGIEAYPTLLLLNPGGKERDRIVGYREAKPFIQDFNSALAGKNAEMRAREAVAKEGEKSLTVRTKLAREFENQGKYAEAMEEYLWGFDEGLKHDPEFAGVRLSFLLRDLARLGQRYAPAKKALESRRDSRENELLGGNDNRAGVNELVRLNEYLGQQEKNLALLDRLEKNHPARAFLIPSVSNQLLEKKRYDDLLAGANPDEVFSRALVLGDEVLIGQTILEKTDLLVDCARNRVIPDPAHPDQPVNKVK